MSASRWTVGLLGLWIAVSAFLGLGSQGHLWNDLLVGAVVLTVGFPLKVESTWEGWTAGALGLWLVVAAFVPGLREGTGLLWNNLLVGGAIALAAVVPPGQRVPTSPGHA